MPDFTMPPDPVLAPTDAAVRPALDGLADPPAAVPQLLPMVPAARSVSRATLRRVIVATLLVGAVAGIGVNSFARSFEVSAADADTAALAAAAEAYLAAIAEGRAADANALVPAHGRAELLSDEVLGDADRVTEAEALDPHADGDRGWVSVRYVQGYVGVERTLEAVRDASGWRLTTSLAEAVQPAWWLVDIVAISGETVREGALLYPARYTTDAFDDGAATLAPTPVWIDGDPETPTQLEIEVGVRPDVASQLGELAAAFLEACRSSGACDIGPGTLTPSIHGVDVDFFDGVGSVEAVIVVIRQDPPDTVAPVHVGVRIGALSDGGEPQCGLLDGGDHLTPAWGTCTP